MVSENSGAQENKIIVLIDSELEDLIPGFLNNRRQDIIKMQAALADGDYETIRILGHSMKGAGGGYGFDTITDIGQALETAAREKEAQILQDQIRILTHYLEHVEVRYE
jgi:HPt (histidine-containing phosphotransfer) domain-containing protein